MVPDTLPTDLEPYESRLYETLRDGLALFEQRYGLWRGTMTLTGERMNVHDCLREVAKANFPNEYRENGQTFELVLSQGLYRVRLKKLDQYLRTSNYPTQEAFAFMSQNDTPVTRVLFEHLVPIRLVLGYVPDGIDVTNSALWLTQPKGLTVTPSWQYRLDRAVDAAEPLTATSPDVPGEGNARVMPRSEEKPTKAKKIGTIDR